MKENHYYIYIVTNKTNSVIYTGVTNNLKRRIYEHRNKIIQGFTKKYNLWKLIYYEYHDNINNAISREKQIKSWRREKKNKLINSFNNNWTDLYNKI